jgi:hypothetical protein
MHVVAVRTVAEIEGGATDVDGTRVVTWVWAKLTEYDVRVGMAAHMRP